MKRLIIQTNILELAQCLRIARLHATPMFRIAGNTDIPNCSSKWRNLQLTTQLISEIN